MSFPLLILAFLFVSTRLEASSHFENFIADKRIFEAKTVKCIYPTTAIVNWEELDDPDPEIDEPDKPLEYTFDSIGQQQARLIGNVGASDVVVVRTGEGLHFMEILYFGSVNTTTIYSSRENALGGDFASVASRHPNLGLGPIPSQHYGKCKVLEYHR
jgi:hypothetical protein